MHKVLLSISISCFLLFSCADNAPKAIKTSNKENTNVELNDEPPSEAPVEHNEYMVDTAKSVLTWIGRKPTEQHDGNINIKMGHMAKGSDGSIQSVIVIDMNSITCHDITDETKNQKLIGHLKNKDFFDVKNFPEASLEINDFRIEKDETINRIAANLQIKGTREIVDFEATITEEKDSVLVSGIMSFDRTKYGIKYKSKSIFSELGDKFIDDLIEIQFEVWFYSLPNFEPTD